MATCSRAATTAPSWGSRKGLSRVASPIHWLRYNLHTKKKSWRRGVMAKIEVKRVRATMTRTDSEPHWIAEVSYGSFEVEISAAWKLLDNGR
jgi:hypothetical protein